MTRSEFNKALALLVASVGRQMPDEMVQAWFVMLNDLTVEQINQGIITAIRTHEFAGFPPIGLIRKHAVGKDLAALPDTDRAVVAWGTVVEAIRQHGGYQTVHFDDPVIHATIRATSPSWAALCGTESEQLHIWGKKSFVEAYRAISASQSVSAGAGDALPGILATDAARDGYAAETSKVLIQTGLPASKVAVRGEKQTTVMIPVINAAARAIRSVPPVKPEIADEPQPLRIEDVDGKRKRQIEAFNKATQGRDH